MVKILHLCKTHIVNYAVSWYVSSWLLSIKLIMYYLLTSDYNFNNTTLLFFDTNVFI